MEPAYFFFSLSKSGMTLLHTLRRLYEKSIEVDSRQDPQQPLDPQQEPRHAPSSIIPPSRGAPGKYFFSSMEVSTQLISACFSVLLLSVSLSLTGFYACN